MVRKPKLPGDTRPRIFRLLFVFLVAIVIGLVVLTIITFLPVFLMTL